MIWVIVLMAVFAALAAAAAPYLVATHDTDRVETTAGMLSQLAAGVDSFNLVAKRGNASFTTPDSLVHLVRTIATNEPAGCTSQTYNNTATGNWATGAPFVTIQLDTNGVWTPLGRVDVRPSSSATSEGAPRASGDPYYIQIPNVDSNLAEQLDLYVDGAVDGGTGTVLYTAADANNTVLLSYAVSGLHSSSC